MESSTETTDIRVSLPKLLSTWKTKCWNNDMRMIYTKDRWIYKIVLHFSSSSIGSSLTHCSMKATFTKSFEFVAEYRKKSCSMTQFIISEITTDCDRTINKKRLILWLGKTPLFFWKLFFWPKFKFQFSTNEISILYSLSFFSRPSKSSLFLFTFIVFPFVYCQAVIYQFILNISFFNSKLCGN